MSSNEGTTPVGTALKSQLSCSQILVTLTLSIGALSLGLILSYSAPAIESLKDRNHTNFEVHDREASWVASVMPLSGLIGAVLGGQLLEFIGRKWTLFAMTIPAFCGWALIGAAKNIFMVLIGRAMTGISCGISAVSFQVYLSETVHPKVRGSLGIFGTLAANAGIVLGYTLGMFLNWYQLAYCGLAIVLPFALMVLFLLPETPRWYIKHEREESARKSLTWLRIKGYDVDTELKQFINAHKEDTLVKSNQFKELGRIHNLKPLFIVIGAIFSAQLTGVNVIVFFNVTIFKMSGTFIQPNLSSIITGIGMTLATFVPVFLSDRVGRKALLTFSGTAIFVLMTLLGTFFYLKSIQTNLEKFTWIPLFSIFSIFVAFSCGYGPIPFLLMGELLPMPIRGIGASLVICSNFLGAFVMSKTFLDLVGLIKTHGVFWMYAILTFLTLIFMLFCIPETKNKSLEEIQQKLSNRYRKDDDAQKA